MSILVLTSDTLIGTPATGNLEYNGQFYGTDSNASRAQMQRITQDTVQLTTSGTSKDFTGIPAWVKKITVMFNETSLSASASLLVQIGSGSVANTGYIATGNFTNQANTTLGVSSTAGFPVYMAGTTYAFSGALVIYLVSGNTYIANHSGKSLTTGANFGGGSVTLGGALDRVRITSTSTDTFDAGSINILYEG